MPKTQWTRLVRRIRGDRSRAELARLIGCTRPLIRHWEHGTSRPSATYMGPLINVAQGPDKLAILATLGVDVGALTRALVGDS